MIFIIIKVAALLILVTTGFNLVFGVLRFVNLAHPEVIVLSVLLVERLSHVMPFAAAAVSGVLLMAALGAILSRTVFFPLRRAPRSNMLASSLGLALVGQVIYITVTRQASLSLRPDPLSMIGLHLDWESLWILATIALTGVIGLELWLSRSRLGAAVTAVAENPILAESWGVSIARIYDAVFAISFGFAALAGVALGVHYSVSFGFAFKLMVWSFCAVLLGGIGQIYGGALASVIVATAWVLLGQAGFEPYVDAMLLFAAAAVYMFLPDGLWGQRLRRI